MPQPATSADRHKRLADAVRQCENVYSQAATAPLHVHGLFDGDASYSKQHLATVSAAGSLATMERRIRELQLQLSAMDMRLQEVTANQQGAGMAPGFFGASNTADGGGGGGGKGGGISDRYFTSPEVQFVRKVTSDMLRPLWEASKHQERLLLDVISTLNFAVENRAFIGGGGGRNNFKAPSRQQHQYYNHTRDQEGIAAADDQLDGELEDRIFNLKRTAHALRSGAMLGDSSRGVDTNNNRNTATTDDTVNRTPVNNKRQFSAAPSYDVVVSPETVASAIVRDIHPNPRGSSTGTTSSSTAGYRQPSSTPTTATTTTTTSGGGTTTTSDEEAFFKGYGSKANDYRQYFPSSGHHGGHGDSERFRRLIDITSSSEDDFLSNRNPHSPHWRQGGGGGITGGGIHDQGGGGGDSSTTTSSGQKAGQETSFVEAVRHIVSGDTSPQGGAATAGQRSVHFGEETVFSHPTDGLGSTTATTTPTTDFNTSNPQRHQATTNQTTNASTMNPSFVTLLNPTSAGSNSSMGRTDISGGGGAGGGTTLYQTAFTSGFDTTPTNIDSMMYHNTSDGSVVSAVVPSTANTSGVVMSGDGGGGGEGRHRGGDSHHDQSGGYADAYRALDAHLR